MKGTVRERENFLKKGRWKGRVGDWKNLFFTKWKERKSGRAEEGKGNRENYEKEMGE
jgi:hypothetical protein